MASRQESLAAVACQVALYSAVLVGVRSLLRRPHRLDVKTVERCQVSKRRANRFQRARSSSESRARINSRRLCFKEADLQLRGSRLRDICIDKPKKLVCK